MKKIEFVAVLIALVLFAASATAQNQALPDGLLQQYATDNLYVADDPDVLDVSGEWTGTEIQYDETKTFIKVKFDIVFDFKQDGNRISGTSYIKDKLHQDYGYMNIRGFVMGDKLYFEEYELTGQQWETPNRVWCFRTGGLDISARGRKAKLSGDYKSYASHDYSPCKDYCYTVVEQDRKMAASSGRGSSESTATASLKEENLLSVAPSPFREQTGLSYSLTEDAYVRLDVFNLSGKKVATLVNGKQAAGSYSDIFRAEGNPPGSYIVRLIAGKRMFTRQVVLMR